MSNIVIDYRIPLSNSIIEYRIVNVTALSGGWGYFSKVNLMYTRTLFYGQKKMHFQKDPNARGRVGVTKPLCKLIWEEKNVLWKKPHG